MPARFKVSITAKAERDIEQIWDFIAAGDPDAADQFIEQLEKQIKRLERLPERCPLILENELFHANYRHLIFGDYRTIFRISKKTVYVVRVIRSSRLLDLSQD